MQSVLAQHISLLEHSSISEQGSLSYQSEFFNGYLESNLSFFCGRVEGLIGCAVDEMDVEDAEFVILEEHYGLVGPTPELGVGVHVQPTGQS